MKSNTVLPMARHRFDISAEEALLSVQLREEAPRKPVDCNYMFIY